MAQISKHLKYDLQTVHDNLMNGPRKWTGKECRKLTNEEYKELDEYMENLIGFYEPIKIGRIKTHNLFPNNAFAGLTMQADNIIEERDRLKRQLKQDLFERKLDLALQIN